MRLLCYYSPALLFMMLWAGCQSKEPKLNMPLEPARVLPENTPLEKEIKSVHDEYGVTFNYLWNRNALERNLVSDPAKVENVLPYIEVFRVVFLESLRKVGGEFAQKESPRIVFLLGTGLRYPNSDGKFVGGRAGNIQANRLTLGGVNTFGQYIRDSTDAAFLRHVYDQHEGTSPAEGGEVGFVYHEWAHHIDMKHGIPKDFQELTADKLVGAFAYTSVTDLSARQQGFMLPYGTVNTNEDFATYVQVMVWKKNMDIEKDILVLSEWTKDKYGMMRDYFEKLGLNLSQLRDTLHSDATKQKLLEIKHKYDGSATVINK